jgi:hypothetical protein
MKKKTIIDDSNPTLQNIRRTSTECCNYMASIFLLALIFLVGCEREVVVPKYLLGEWKTSAPTYEDRYIKFSERTVTYGIGDGEEVTHTIDKIKSKQGDGGTIYTFYYRNAEDQKDHLTVTYRPDSGGTFQIKNSNEIWKKADPGQAG